MKLLVNWEKKEMQIENASLMLFFRQQILHYMIETAHCKL